MVEGEVDHSQVLLLLVPAALVEVEVVRVVTFQAELVLPDKETVED
jgi:hypothetical protein